MQVYVICPPDCFSRSACCRNEVIVAKDAAELAGVLGLSPVDGAEIQLRSDLNDKIIEVVRKTGLTHDQGAKLARTSRSRITAILNRNTKEFRQI